MSIAELGDRIVIPKIAKITIDVMLLSSEPIVSARCTRRPASTVGRAGSALRPARAVARSTGRAARRPRRGARAGRSPGAGASGAPGPAGPATRMASGLPISQLAAWASHSLPVVLSTAAQATVSWCDRSASMSSRRLVAARVRDARPRVSKPTRSIRWPRDEPYPARDSPTLDVGRAALVLALGAAIARDGLAGAAFADAPGAGSDPPTVSPLHAILMLVRASRSLLFALISLLVYLPSMRAASGYQPGQPWRDETEWFGGPRDGVEAADEPRPRRPTPTASTGRRWHQWPLVTPSAPRQRHEIDQAIRAAEKLVPLRVLGLRRPRRGRVRAVRRAGCTPRWSRRPRSILIMVDPAARAARDRHRRRRTPARSTTTRSISPCSRCSPRSPPATSSAASSAASACSPSTPGRRTLHARS